MCLYHANWLVMRLQPHMQHVASDISCFCRSWQGLRMQEIPTRSRDPKQALLNYWTERVECSHQCTFGFGHEEGRCQYTYQYSISCRVLTFIPSAYLTCHKIQNTHPILPPKWPQTCGFAYILLFIQHVWIHPLSCCSFYNIYSW